MSLIGFHRFLIVSGIVFCFAFAGWELLRWWVGGPGSLVLGGTFVVLGAALIFYLARLRRFLGYEEGDAGRGSGSVVPDVGDG